MKALQEEIKLPTQNDAVLASTLGKIYQIVLKSKSGTIAEKVLDTAKLHELILHLLAAPEELLPSC
jgi:hypothetical protein